MSTVEELNKILTEVCEQLVECSSIIRDIPLEPHKKNMYKVGKALAEISNLRAEIYKNYPNLKPSKWGEPLTDQDYEEMYNTAIEMAEEYINEGKYERALETYETFIFIRPSGSYVEIIKKNIDKIRVKYSV